MINALSTFAGCTPCECGIITDCPEVLARGGNKLELGLLLLFSIVLTALALLAPKILKKKKLSPRRLTILRAFLILLAVVATSVGVYRYSKLYNDETYYLRNYEEYMKTPDDVCIQDKICE